jgi:hypothetical protein
MTADDFRKLADAATPPAARTAVKRLGAACWDECERIYRALRVLEDVEWQAATPATAYHKEAKRFLARAEGGK